MRDLQDQIRFLILKYKATIEIAEVLTSTFPSNGTPRVVQFASTCAVIDAYKNVIIDLEKILET